MKILIKVLYNLIFWISRVFTISVFSILLLTTLHAKHIFSGEYLQLFTCLIENLDRKSNIIANLLYIFNIDEYLFYNFKVYYFGVFCSNSQNIDLLLIALAIILILSIVIVKFISKEFRFLLILSVISSVVYLTMYSIFKLPIMLALTISTPIILIIIYFLNRICPIQKVIMLVPIIGEIFCTEGIIKYIFKNSSNKIKQIYLLAVALIVSNIICFLLPYKTDKDFENRIMNNWTYSIRPYQDKLIISGDEEFIIIDKNGNDTYIKNI